MRTTPCPECRTTTEVHAGNCSVPAWLQRHLGAAPPLSPATKRKVGRLLAGGAR